MGLGTKMGSKGDWFLPESHQDVSCSFGVRDGIKSSLFQLSM